MSCRVGNSLHERVNLCRKKSGEMESLVRSTVTGGKPNRCVILPASSTVVAEALERRKNNWIVRTKVASDLIVQLGDSSFHLHKLPMVSKSGFLNRKVFQERINEEKSLRATIIHIGDFPGGAEIFELVVKFCYGWKIDISASNGASLYCAAHFLEMTDDLEPGNLLSRAAAFLTFLIFSSWKDIFRILKSCELISSWAKELQIVKRCTEAIAWKASINPKAFSFEGFDMKTEEVDENWWFEDASSLRIDHFIEVIESVKRNGMRPEIIGLCIAQWTSKWLSRVTLGNDNVTQKNLNHKLQRVTAESLIKLLPVQENSVSCNFLLHLLKLGSVLRISSELLDKLVNRVALMLEHSCVTDLLVKNYKENDSVYDVEIVARVLKFYVSSCARKMGKRIFTVGRLVDGYLTQIAREKKLKVQDFQLLAEALPISARYCDDNLYRAIDMYLKAHPELTEEERLSASKSMDYHKLSQEARHHAMKNDRLPLEITTRFILLEQVNMTRKITAVGSDYRRTKTQAIIRMNKGLGRGTLMKQSQNEIKMMKEEVEIMKVQLNNLQMCKVEIQRQAKRCVL